MSSPDPRQCAWKGFPEEVASKPMPQDSGNQPREVMWEKGREQRILWDEWLHALRPGEMREPGAHREWLVAQCGWNDKSLLLCVIPLEGRDSVLNRTCCEITALLLLDNFS